VSSSGGGKCRGVDAKVGDVDVAQKKRYMRLRVEKYCGACL
jgi:hypothetical protein